MEPLELFFPIKPMGLNGKDGLIRAHWAQRKGEVKTLALMFQERVAEFGPWLEEPFPRQLGFRVHTSRLMDWDNVGASFKNVGDALVMAGILDDDTPTHLLAPLLDQCKVKRVDVGFTLTLYPSPN